MANVNFCRACGSIIDSWFEYCPFCGAVLAAVDHSPSYDEVFDVPFRRLEEHVLVSRLDRMLQQLDGIEQELAELLIPVQSSTED